MDGYNKAIEVINELIKNQEKNLQDAMKKVENYKNGINGEVKDSALAHGYEMMVIAYEDSVASLRIGLRTIKMHRTRKEFDNNVHAHEQTMKSMIESLTK